jgi:glycosyltransferase involved in cell wall biosynthesis
VTRFALVNPPGEYHSPDIGGAVATVNYNLARALLRSGHDVTVLSSLPQRQGYDSVPTAPLEDVKRLARAKRKLAHWEVLYRHYDAEAYGFHIRSVRRALAQTGPVEVVVTHNDVRAGAPLRRWFPEALWVPWLHNEIRTRADGIAQEIAAATLVVCVSRYIETWTRNRYELDPELFTVALSGVDSELFFPRKDHDLQEGPLRVLYVGRLILDKGADLVVDAVAALKKQGLSAEVTVIGSSWWYGDENQLEDWFAGGVIAQTLAMGGAWQPHASRSLTAEIFRQHDVVCVLSRFQEPASLVALEAMASGCALIATDRGGIPEMAGGAGVIVPANDVRSVIETLATWCSDRVQLQRAKARSLERAKAAGWDRTARQFLTALDRRTQR